MQLLLDTHTFVWFLANDLQLSVTTSRLIRDASNVIFISAATGWEITTKVRSGRWPAVMPLARTFRATVAGQGFLELPVTVEHACLAGLMPGTHRDPFDRMLAAQSRTENLPVVSIDDQLDQFAITRIWY